MVRGSDTPLLSTLLVALTLLIFVIDALTPLDIAIAVMYVVVVLLSASIWQRHGVILVTTLCLLLTLIAYGMSHALFFDGPASGRLLVSLAAIGITAFLALKSQAVTNDLLQREESLRRSEAFLAGTQRISKTGSFSFKVPSGVMYWSAEAARIFGYDASVSPTIERVLEHTAPEDRNLVRGAFDRALRGEGPIDVRHRLMLPEEGGLKYVHVLAHAGYNQAGECEFLGALVDITESVLAEQALHRSQLHLAHVTRVTMLGEMAASIAHEVNQPLAAISANGQACLRWLGRPQPEVDEARAAVASLLDASARATDVISSIRALARKSEPQHLALDLSAVAVEAVELVRRELASQQIALMLELAGDLPPVCGDRVQLQQVMINLMMNAMQAMQSCAPAQAVLTVQTERAGDGAVQFSVSDSGPGIPPQHLPKLFDAFFSSRADGMGMGLAICRSIVDAHGGRIWAHSPPGAGATFQFSLPVQAMDCA